MQIRFGHLAGNSVKEDREGKFDEVLWDWLRVRWDHCCPLVDTAVIAFLGLDWGWRIRVSYSVSDGLVFFVGLTF